MDLVYLINSVIAFQGATGFVVGSNTIVTNKHVTKNMKVGDRVNAHPSSFGNSGGRYTITKIVEYSVMKIYQSFM
ncbi:trypsin-like serine protease [Staphylococcus pseudintermedius]|nr:hypothetical protein [Staphylococcus pseudintermedius]EGQ2810609.1 trypsin-like serine protease [Staphylococcus pseudintermedius]EGQ2831540.1 trypsin-like serine protease [Staphylococcus pseudintermedius]EGQ2969088.1 hypothetical protein [Staphylococcus pseudintermedius]EGQ3040380.1 trypsin-like serine protease [Staphylococcus pseudintermedius]